MLKMIVVIMTQNMSADGRMFSQSCSESRLTFPANAILCTYFFNYFSFYVHFKNRHSPIQVCLPLDSSIVYELCALEHQNKSIYLLVYL